MSGGNSCGFLTVGFEPGGFEGGPTGDPVGGVNLKNTLYEILGVFRHPSKVLFGKTEVSTHYIVVSLIQRIIKEWGETTEKENKYSFSKKRRRDVLTLAV
jgi:hypothetical protein